LEKQSFQPIIILNIFLFCSQIQPTAEEAFAAFQVMAEAIIDNKCDSY